MDSKYVLMHVLPSFLQPSHSNHILAYKGESRVAFTFIFLRSAAENRGGRREIINLWNVTPNPEREKRTMMGAQGPGEKDASVEH